MMRLGGRRNGAKPMRHKPARRVAALESHLLARFNRAEGQLRGIQRMVAGGAYCIDILQQISAVRRALDKLALILIRDHMETCLSDAIRKNNPEKKMRELIATLDRFLA